MIKKIELENYRCYKKYNLELSNFSVIVGKNNAGKSTIVESLRIVSAISQKFKNLGFKSPPAWVQIPKSLYGVSLSLKTIGISSSGLFYKNSNPPAKITATFFSGEVMQIYIGEEGENFVVLYDQNGELIKSKQQSQDSNFPGINILPQMGPLKKEEETLSQDYVKSNLDTRLSSLHFRNQLDFLFENYFQEFKETCEKTWDNLVIKEFQPADRVYSKNPELFIEVDGYTTEVGNVGDGLQIWLQAMWFITRCEKGNAVILDEPDVYLHADMQRRLVEFLKKEGFPQIVIATHSIEIISALDPDNIVIVDKKKTRSQQLSTFPAVQKILNEIGSIQNIELTRYWSSGRFLFVEGMNDVKVLQRIYRKISNKINDLELIPIQHTGGWGSWKSILDTSAHLNQLSNIKVYAVFDSDYTMESKKDERRKEALSKKINLHIWAKKEIENYLIIPEAIFRMLKKISNSKYPSLDEIDEKIKTIVDSLKHHLIESYASSIQDSTKPRLDLKTAMQRARNLIESGWTEKSNGLDLVSGKKVISLFNDWTQAEYGLSFSISKLTDYIYESEIDAEIKEIVLAISGKKNFVV